MTKIESEPKCAIDSNGASTREVEISNVLVATCSVNYAGNWASVMKWQQDGVPVITAGVVNNTVPYKSVISRLTVLITRNVTGSKFSCTTYFSDDNKPSSSSAANVPDYSSRWMMDEFNLQFKLQSLHKHYKLQFIIIMLIHPAINR